MEKRIVNNKKITPSILIIDDDPENLLLISQMLNKSFAEISIYSASSGTAGLKIAKNYIPDIILLDIIMPDIDGYEVCKFLKNDQLTKNIPVIVITGLEVQMQAKIKALNLGAEAFLSKPLRKAELIAQIKVMLRIKFAEDQLKEEKRELEKLVNIRTEKLQLLTQHTLAIMEEERSRISRGLHDELGQMLVGLQMGHDSILKIISKGDDISSEKDTLALKVKDLINMTEHTFDAVRNIIHDLRPPVLDHLGLASAIEWLALDFSKKSEIKILFKNTLNKKLLFSLEQNIAIFRIIQESLTNIAKHSKGTEGTIYIRQLQEGGIEFEIKDNGCGIDQKGINGLKKFGIMGMYERANQFNWQMEIEGTPGIGTKVILITGRG